jgi:hypothetical protein
MTKTIALGNHVSFSALHAGSIFSNLGTRSEEALKASSLQFFSLPALNA